VYSVVAGWVSSCRLLPQKKLSKRSGTANWSKMALLISDFVALSEAVDLVVC
jgi:hypothetical protein